MADRLNTPLFVPVYPSALFNTTAVEPEITPFTALVAEVELIVSVEILVVVPPIKAAPEPDEIVKA